MYIYIYIYGHICTHICIHIDTYGYIWIHMGAQGHGPKLAAGSRDLGPFGPAASFGPGPCLLGPHTYPYVSIRMHMCPYVSTCVHMVYMWSCVSRVPCPLSRVCPVSRVCPCPMSCVLCSILDGVLCPS